MNKPEFVYVTYIATTPEKLWQALTTPEFTRQYWFGTAVESDWQVGSPVNLRGSDGEITDEGEVLECEPPKRLVFTFHALYEEMRHEAPSRVTYTLEPQGKVVKFTLVHDQFEPDSKVFKAIQGGWPSILASLKTLLETGHALPDGTVECEKKAS